MSAETPTSPTSPNESQTPHEPVPPGTPLSDRLVAAAKDLGLPPKTEEVIRKADDFIADAVRSAGTFTDERRDKISEFLDKAEKAIDDKTDGKYADKVGKARAQAEKGVAKLAEQGRGTDAPADAPVAPQPAAPTSATASSAPASPSPASPSPASPAATAPPAASSPAPAPKPTFPTDPTGDASVGEDPAPGSPS